MFLMFVGCSACRATLILTACSGEGIVIAADGLLLKPGGDPPFITGCKITEGTDDCFFAVSGVQDIHSIHYDLVPMSINACRERGSIADRAGAFEKAALPEVRRAWQHIKAHEPITYSLMRRSGPARVTVVFAGDHPFTVAIVQYTENSSGNMDIDNQVVDIGSLVSNPAYERIGASDNVETYHRQHPEIDKLDDVGFLRSMLLGTIQLETEPKRMGPPIAILRIDDKGARWIDKGACGEIKHHQSPEKRTAMQSRR